jgi:hypothetical protein
LSRCGARCVLPAKISKTTPCKGAGGRHGCVEGSLTRRANQGHFPTIPPSCNARRSATMRRLRLRLDIPPPPLELNRPTTAVARA